MKFIRLILIAVFAVASQAKAETVLNRHVGPEPGTLDNQLAQGIPSSEVQRDLFEGLVYDAADGTLIPGAAERWEISEDAKEYIFYLRENGRWSDGTPVTAHDFVFALRRLVDPRTGAIYSFMARPILNAAKVISAEAPPEELGVEAINDYTLAIRLESPTPYLLSMLTHSSMFPVSKKNVEKFGDQWTRPGNMVSNGAYHLVEWVPQSHIKLVKNPHFRGVDELAVDTVYHHVVEDMNTAMRKYQAGELDTLDQAPLRQCGWYIENMPEHVRFAPYLGSYYYSINMEDPKFQDIRIRRALALAVNREMITERITCRGQEAALTLVPSKTKGRIATEGPWDDTTYAERLAEAKKLMTEAGYGPDNPLEVEILYNTLESHKKIAVAIAAMWKQIGVRTSLRNEEWKVLLNSRNQGQFEVTRQGWIGDYNDPYTFLEIFHSSAGSINETRYNSAAFNDLLDQAQKETDAQKRYELLARAERVLLNDQPVIPLYFYVSQSLAKPYVKGWEDNIMDRHPTRWMRIEK